MELPVHETAERDIKAEDGCSPSAVMWERFLPKMAVRVLLVEADDSTRQIIAALLRKCSYKVAAVADGLQAWEALKGRSHGIDLILAEVELPSISGYALLSLIMEHNVCKHIPVIMMSSHDSVRTVYKCMLRGAADFLVKPIRRNELRNLWQHVWRKQAVSPKQSSCTKPKLDGIRTSEEEECHQESWKNQVHDNEEGAMQAATDANYGATEGHDRNSYDGCEQFNGIDQTSENNHGCENSRKAIDLIGAFDNYPMGTFGIASSNASANKIDILPPLLDLSLKRSHPSGSVNQVNDEKCSLNHSDASAFSRYINKPLRPSTCNQRKVHETNSRNQQSNHAQDYNSDTHGPTTTSVPSITFHYHHQREMCQPVPVRGLSFNDVINGFGSLTPQMHRAPSSLSPLPCLGTTNHSLSFTQSNTFYHSDHQTPYSHQFLNHLNQTSSHAIDQTDHRHCQKLGNLEDRRHVLQANDQSGNSSFYNVHINHCNSKSSGGNGKIDTISAVKAASECGDDEEASHRSVQREVALTKFRLKRKDRCFEKKVRYESRKRLAEQRPRVKGQFVRQVPNDSQPGNSGSNISRLVAPNLSFSNFRQNSLDY